jgi:hypothetical protein
MEDELAKQMYYKLRSFYMDIRRDESKEKLARETQDLYMELGRTIDWTDEELEDMANGYQ